MGGEAPKQAGQVFDKARAGQDLIQAGLPGLLGQLPLYMGQITHDRRPRSALPQLTRNGQRAAIFRIQIHDKCRRILGRRQRCLPIANDGQLHARRVGDDPQARREEHVRYQGDNGHGLPRECAIASMIGAPGAASRRANAIGVA
jgi:hypothetical protein